MFFNVYVFALILGGILLVASLVMGQSKDFGVDGDLDLDSVDEIAAGDLAGGETTTSEAVADAGGFFTALVSLRFWTFFAAFFGLTGVLYEQLGLINGDVTSLAVALIVGAATGFGAVRILRALRASSSGLVATSDAYIGRSGRVLTGFGPDQLGKIRVEIAGTSVDVLATTDDVAPFASGDEALIVEMRGHKAFVARLSAKPPGASSANRT